MDLRAIPAADSVANDGYDHSKNRAPSCNFDLSRMFLASLRPAPDLVAHSQLANSSDQIASSSLTHSI